MTIIFTTAGKNDDDGYPFDPDAAGERATIRRAPTGNTGSMVLTSTNLTLSNIILDGNNVTSNESGGLIRVDGSQSVTLKLDRGDKLSGSEAVLQKSAAKYGGAVYLERGSLELTGGVIRLCSATLNGGGVYLKGGESSLADGKILQCSAGGNGGGVYLEGGPLMFSGASITENTAAQGGGVYVVNGKTLNMSGGFITENTATTSGGGIAVGGTGSRLIFTGRPNVSRNKLGDDGTICNVELNQTNTWIIQSEKLSPGAYIGVYVAGVYEPLTNEEIAQGKTHSDNDTPAYSLHGGRGDPFGHFRNLDTSRLYCFVNDRNGLKGGLNGGQNPSTDTQIYWVKIFSLKVAKEIQVTKAEEETKNQTVGTIPFHFIVRLREHGDIIESISGEYGDMIFDKGVAEFDLRAIDPAVMAVNLPDGLQYEVEEDLTRPAGEDLEKRFAPLPASIRRGTIGENEEETDPEIKYTSDATFTNMLPVCKITDKNGNLLYRYMTVKGVSYKVPAVFTELEDAFDALDKLYTNESAYGEGESVNIEMLVSQYTLTQAIELEAGKIVTLKTASKDAESFPYRGNGDTAEIDRGFGELSMFTVYGDLKLDNVILDGKKTTYTVTNDGGLVNLQSGTLAIVNNACLQNSYTTRSGGAVYAAPNTEITMTDGRVKANESLSDGAGIYLSQDSTLYLSGSLDFGGTGITYGEINKTDGNRKRGELSGKTNGKKLYTLARQDIFLAEEGTEDHIGDPASLVVTGDLIGNSGTIWVWASSQYHYKTRMPFARVADDAGFSTDNNPAVFRNAQDDDTTENDTDTYLFGVDGMDGLLYWSGNDGTRRVILRKVDGSQQSINGASFIVYKGTSTTPYVTAEGEELNPIPKAGDGNCSYGILWAGDLGYGIYYLEEKAPSDGKWFYLIVDDPEYMTSDPIISSAFSSREAARLAAEPIYAQIQNSKRSG